MNLQTIEAAGYDEDGYAVDCLNCQTRMRTDQAETHWRDCAQPDQEDFRRRVRYGMLLPEHWPMSYSSLDLFDECALQYKLQKQDKMPRTGHPKAMAGDDYHDRIQARYEGGLDTLAPPSAPLKVWADVHDFLSQADRMTLDTEHLLGTEMTFNWTWEVPGPPGGPEVVHVHWEARIDRLHVYPDGRAKIVDYKTGRVVPRDVDNDPQGLTYAVGILEDPVNGRPDVWEFDFEQVQVQYDMVKRPKQPFSLQKVLAFREYLKMRSAQIVQETRWRPNPGDHCYLCPYALQGCTAGGKLVNYELGPLTTLEAAQSYVKLWLMLDVQKRDVAKHLKGWMERHGPIQIETGSYQMVPVESYSVPPDKVPDAIELISEFSGLPIGAVAEEHLSLTDVKEFVEKIPELKAMAIKKGYGRPGFKKTEKRAMKTHAPRRRPAA